MKTLRASIALWLLFITISTQAQTQNSPIGGWGAIVIGISQYKEVTPLQFADRDAVAFAEFLKTQQVPEDNIKLFLNENATRFNIVDELYNTSLQLKKGDRFYFYFGGHGDLEARIGYENSLLLLYNSFKKSYFQGNEYLQLSELKTWFEALTKKGVEVVFIADACHSGGLIGGKEGNTKTQKALQESWANITKILSCKADEFSLEGKQWGGGRGIFSYHLVNGLTGRADANKDNKVSLNELNNYLTTNVLREANPNIQTPVILGSNKQFLSKVSKEGLAKLADYEKRNFPIITEVNLKGGEEKLTAGLISKLDTTLVSTYKQFIKSLKDKRLNTFDDSTATDYALLHYRKLMARNIPDNLVQMMKRNLGAALLEREFALLKNAREQGRGFVVRIEKQLNPAIANLDEAMKLFGPDHHLYRFFQARRLVLESKTKFPSIPPSSKSVDAHLQEIETERLKYYYRERRLLLQALDLEPNMISTYALLSSNYREIRGAIHESKQSIRDQMPDSSIYYQEKVVELLPNQAEAHFSLASSYQQNQILPTDSKGYSLLRTHPKAVEHLERAAALDTNFIIAYSQLANLYKGGDIHDPFHNYPKAIEWYEKLLKKDEVKEQEFLKQGIDKYLQAFKAEISPIRANFNSLCSGYINLLFLHKVNGDTVKADEYWQKLNEKSDKIATAGVYMTNAMNILFLYQWNEDDDDLWKALTLQEKAIKQAELALKEVADKDKPLATLRYQYYLKTLGAAHRSVKNYDKAEMYLQQAIAYPVLKGPYTGNLKLMGSWSGSNVKDGQQITLPLPIQDLRNGVYHYRIEANWEMFLLKYEQGKIDEAFEWLEKGFQVAVAENGNDLSGEPMEIYFTKDFPQLKDRFKALKAKYFPPTEKK